MTTLFLYIRFAIILNEASSVLAQYTCTQGCHKCYYTALVRDCDCNYGSEWIDDSCTETWDYDLKEYPYCTLGDLNFENRGHKHAKPSNKTGLHFMNNYMLVEFVLLKQCIVDAENVKISLSITGHESPGATNVEFWPGSLNKGYNNIILKIGQDVYSKRDFVVLENPPLERESGYVSLIWNPLANICWDPVIIPHRYGKFDLFYAWRVSNDLKKLLDSQPTEWQYYLNPYQVYLNTSEPCIPWTWSIKTAYVEVMAVMNDFIVFKDIQFVNLFNHSTTMSKLINPNPGKFFLRCLRNCYTPASMLENIILEVFCYDCLPHRVTYENDGFRILKQRDLSMSISSNKHITFTDESHMHVVPKQYPAKKLDVISIVTRNVRGNGTYKFRVIYEESLPVLSFWFNPQITDEGHGDCGVRPSKGFLIGTEFSYTCFGFENRLTPTFTFIICEHDYIRKHSVEPFYVTKVWRARDKFTNCMRIIVRTMNRIIFDEKIYVEIEVDFDKTRLLDRPVIRPYYEEYDDSTAYDYLKNLSSVTHWLNALDSNAMIEGRPIAVRISRLITPRIAEVLIQSNEIHTLTALRMLLQIYWRGLDHYRDFRTNKVLAARMFETLNNIVKYYDSYGIITSQKDEIQQLFRYVIEITLEFYKMDESNITSFDLLYKSSAFMLYMLIPQESYSTVNQSSYLILYDWFTNKSTFSVEKKVTVDKRILRAKITVHNHVDGNKTENCKFGFALFPISKRSGDLSFARCAILGFFPNTTGQLELEYPITRDTYNEAANLLRILLANATRQYDLSQVLNLGDVARLHMRATCLSQADTTVGLEDSFEVVMCEKEFTNWDELEDRKDCIMTWDVRLTEAKKLYKKSMVKVMTAITSDPQYTLNVRYLSSMENQMEFEFGLSKYQCKSMELITEPWDNENCFPDFQLDTMEFACLCFDAIAVMVDEGIENLKELSVEKIEFDSDKNRLLVIIENVIMKLSNMNSLWPMVMVSSIWIIFISLAIWARIKDKLMKTMSLPIDLADNAASSRYIYLIIVKTGGRIGSGTTSRVYFNLTGTKGVSASHRFVCHKYQVLQRTQTNIFLMRAKSSLGDLVAIKFWHRNMGNSPAWFVSRVSIADLQSKRIYYFLCDSWVGNNNFEDIVIMKMFTVATKIMTYNLKYLISFNASRSFSDNHTLFSIFFCPITSRFNRFERVGVCMNLLIGYLMCNLLFIQFDDANGDGQAKQNLGRLLFSTERIYAAFQCALIMFPVTTGIEGVFQCVIRRKRMIGIIMDWRRRNVIMMADFKELDTSIISKIFSNLKASILPIKGAYLSSKLNLDSIPLLGRSNVNVNSLYRGTKIRESSMRRHKGPSGRLDLYNFKPDSWKDMFNTEVVVQTTEHTLADYKSEKLENGFLPPISSFMAWTVIVSSVVLFSMGVIYGTSEYDDSELMLWAAACLMSFCIGMIIDDPFKIILASLFYSLVVRKVKEHAFRNSEKYKFMCLRGLEFADEDADRETLSVMHMSGDYQVPKKSLNMLLLEAAQMKEESRRIIVRLAFYLTITISCIGLALISHDYSRNQLVRTCERILFQRENFRNIKKIDDFWGWMNTTFIDKFYLPDHDARGGDDFKRVDMEGMIMRNGPCLRRTSGNSPVWAFYPSGVTGTNRDAMCMNLTRLSALKVIQQAYESAYLNPDYYFNQLEIQVMDTSSMNIFIIEVKVFIMPGGGMVIWGIINALPLYTDETDYRVKLLFNVILISLLAIFTTYTFRSLIYVGVADFFVSFWNLMDLIIAVLTIFYLPALFFYGYDVRLFGVDWETGRGRTAGDMLLSQGMMNFLANTTVVLFVIKGLSYLRYNSSISAQFDYLWSCVPSTILVLIMSMSVMLGLSTGLYTLYGPDVRHLSTQEYALTKFILHFFKVTRFGNIREVSIWAPFNYACAVLLYTTIFKNLCVAIIVRKHRMYSPRNVFKEQIYFKAVMKVFFRFINATSPRRVLSWWRENKGWNKVAPTIRTADSEVYGDESTLQLTDQMESSESNTGGTTSQ